MTPNEINFVVWGSGLIIAILGFISVFLLNRLTKTLDRLQKDVGEIKTSLQVHGAKHEELEKRVDKLEAKLE